MSRPFALLVLAPLAWFGTGFAGQVDTQDADLSADLDREIGQCGQGAVWLTQGERLLSVGPKQASEVADLTGLQRPVLLCSDWGTKLTGERDGQQVMMNLKARAVDGEQVYPTAWDDMQLSPSGSWLVVSPRTVDDEAVLQWIDLTNLEAVDAQRGGEHIEAAWMANEDVLVTAASYWGEQPGVSLTVWWPNDPMDSPGWEMWIDGLTTGAESLGNAGIQSSPDGRYAAVSLVDPDGRSKLVVMDLEDRKIQTYVDVRGKVAWSPDSTRLLGWRRVGQNVGAPTDLIEVNVAEKKRRSVSWQRGPLSWFLPQWSTPHMLWLNNERALVGSSLGDHPVALIDDGQSRTVLGARLNLHQSVRTDDGAAWTLGTGRLWRVGPKGQVRVFDLGMRAKLLTVNNDGHLVVVDGRRTVAVVFDPVERERVRTIAL